jgi:hypothetical protein
MSAIQLGQSINGLAANDQLGFSVSMNSTGNRIAIGSPYRNNSAGRVTVYEYVNSSLVRLGSHINGSIGEQFGYSVSLNSTGDILVIGAIYSNNLMGDMVGSVKTYKWNGTSWSHDITIRGGTNGSQFGYAVSLNAAGDILAVGANGHNGGGILNGQVNVYKYIYGMWEQIGTRINGEASRDNSGWSVSLNDAGDRVAIGAPENDGNGVTSGHARVYEWNGTSWVKLGLDIDGENPYDESGFAVSLNGAGNRIAIGAPKNDGNGAESGHVRVYEWDGTSWVKIGNDIDGYIQGNMSGYSLSLNSVGDRVVVGGVDLTGNQKGSVVVYQYSGSTWNKIVNEIIGTNDYDQLGYSVAMNSEGNRIVVGIPAADISGTNSGQARVYEISGNVTSSGSGSGSGSGTGTGTGSGTGANMVNGRIPIEINLNVTIDTSGSLTIFGSQPETVSNIIVSQTTMPVDSLYDGSGGLIEFWEPSNQLGNINVSLYNSVAGGYQATTKKLAAGFHKVLSHAFDCSGATPYYGIYNNVHYYEHSDFGRVSLSTYAHYLFGHVAATAAITNDIGFMKNMLSLSDGAGDSAVGATGVASDRISAWKHKAMVDASNVQQWNTTFSTMDANLAVRLAYAVVSKGLNVDGSINVSDISGATSSTLSNIVKQVLGQDASRAMGQDNNELSPDVKQLLRFYAGDIIYVQIRLPKPVVSVSTGQKVTPSSLQDSVTEQTYTLKITLG